jgi:hypothetical protein
MSKSIFGLAIAFVFVLIAGSGDLAQAQSANAMEFKGELTNLEQAAGGNRWIIFADGMIAPDTSARLEQFIRSNRVPFRSTIYLNSPGGDLLAGIELGRTIRKYHLVSEVGQRGPYSGESIFQSIDIRPGACVSACALAFLGGEYRFVNNSSGYGVHRFYSISKTLNGDAAQIVSAAVVQYIRDMDVDPQLFTFMTEAGPNEVVWVPPNERERLNVVNNGRKKAQWSLESAPQGLIYLKGEWETIFGIGKFIIACAPGRGSGMSLVVIFDPDGHGDTLPDRRAYGLIVDEETIPIDSYLKNPPEIRNALVEAEFRLDQRLLGVLSNARTVGIAFQYDHSAPAFIGFQGMPFADGAKKLTGLVNACTAK